VIDGFLADAIPVSADGAGNWTTTVPIARFGPGVRQHTVIAYARDQRVTSAVQTFASLLEFGAPVLTVADDIGDDHGPAGDYVYPTDSTYRRGQMDIENIEIAVAGSNLQITLTMGEISQVWGPIYGFDHASVTAYLDLPGGDGATVLPLANAVAPPSVSWDMASVIFGWGIALYSDEGATADAWGEPVSPVPEVAVSPAERTITMTYTTRALGRPATLSGTKIYITTWDLDGLSGTYRFLEPEAGAFSMGGGNYDTDPLIMDDTQVLVIP
ncbi:MAG: glucodextranase DOMON-like domain-containing protein, partial [Myxococcota bacterium]